MIPDKPATLAGPQEIQNHYIFPSKRKVVSHEPFLQPGAIAHIADLYYIQGDYANSNIIFFPK